MTPTPNDNLTAILYGVEDLRLEQKPIPEINDDQVLLEMDSVGNYLPAFIIASRV